MVEVPTSAEFEEYKASAKAQQENFEKQFLDFKMEVLARLDEPDEDGGSDPGDGEPSEGVIPGHQPSKIYLGWAHPLPTYEDEVARLGLPGVQRYYCKPTELEKERSVAQTAWARGSLPWGSFSGLNFTDADFERRVLEYQTWSQPALITWAHEPVGDMTYDHYTRTWRRLLDVADRLGGTGQVTLCPIMNGFPWGAHDTWTDTEIAEWFPQDLLERWKLLGMDVYHGGTLSDPKDGPANRVGRILKWAERARYAGLFGFGETGTHTADEWVSTWSVIVASKRFMTVAWFNSTRNNRPGVNWYLADGEPRTREFLKSLASSDCAWLSK